MRSDIGERFALGGERELEELVDTFGEKLLRYSTSILYNHQDAEDVVQDVFLRAYRSRCGFDGKNVSAWLYKITYNLSLNKLRRRRWFSSYDTSVMRDITVYPVFPSDADSVFGALGMLKPSDRALLYGRIIEGFSYEELSPILGKSSAALRKQFERAKKKAEKLLEVDGLRHGEIRKENEYV